VQYINPEISGEKKLADMIGEISAFHVKKNHPALRLDVEWSKKQSR
jgi:hypothetical protein